MLIANLAPLALSLFLAFASPFSYEFSGNTSPSGEAYIEITTNETFRDVEVEIRGDGRTLTRSLGTMKGGSTQKVAWTQKGDKARYEVDLRSPDGTGAFAFEVVKVGATASRGPVALKPRATIADIRERGTAIYETTFQTTKYEFKVYDSDGDVIASEDSEATLSPGDRITVKWPSSAEVFLIHVKAEATDGRVAEYKEVPWSVAIPHTEINFDSGKFDVKTDEAAKLDEALAVAMHELAAVEKANAAVGAKIQPKLYIVGYTDTVGPAGSNQKLSHSRAKAIAEYFRDKGFWAPIAYAGMGERGLRVETPDNTDEVRNRRALYLIGVQDPSPGGAIPSGWTRLVGARSRPAGGLPPLPEKWANYREERRGGKATSDGSVEVPGDEPGANATAVEERDATPEDLDVDYGGGDGTPPPVEGEPGATQKGCQVSADSPRGGVVAWLLLLVAVARRRRSGSARRA